MILDDDFSYNDVMQEFEVIISETMERLPEPLELGELELSYELGQCFLRAREAMEKLGTKEVTVTQLMCEILCTDECWANFLLRDNIDDLEFFLEELNGLCGNLPYEDEDVAKYAEFAEARNGILDLAQELGKHFSEMSDMMEDEEPSERGKRNPDDWRKWVTCVNDHLEERNPLIGREDELERTIRVLCRRDKNNPLHVGDPGVGKTALIYGLAAKIKAGEVPERLKNAQIFSLDVSTLLAGTQYRGDFEKRWKLIMDGLLTIDNAIVYIDEIHTIVGQDAPLMEQWTRQICSNPSWKKVVSDLWEPPLTKSSTDTFLVTELWCAVSKPSMCPNPPLMRRCASSRACNRATKVSTT